MSSPSERNEPELIVPGHELWIVDTSPLIGFAKIGRLDLLTGPRRHVLITETVVREVEAGPENDPARVALAGGWGERVPTPPVPPALADWRLDAGEEATLALALGRPGALAVLDDTDGRRAARALGVDVVGTTGVVLRARQGGRLDAMAPVLRDLRDADIFLPRHDVLVALLASVGETWL